MEFVSIHIPKTGGTIFLRRVLRKLYCEVRKDYRAGKAMVDTAPIDTEELSVVHGHFPYGKYGTDVPHITWLRDPVERMVSHFDDSNRKREKQGKADLDLGGFLRSYQNPICWYTRGSLDNFAFVGLLEQWRQSMERFGEWAEVDTEPFISVEFLTSMEAAYSGYEKTLLTPLLRGHIEELNKDDYVLYRQALERWAV